MAHVHRQTYTRPIPPRAEPVVVRGRGACVRWKGRNREWIVGELIPDRPGRCRCRSPKWYVTYYDHVERRELTVPGYADRAATDQLMAKLVRQSAQVDAGLLPPEAARPRLTLTELLGRWQDYTRHSGSSAAGAYRRWQRAAAVVAGVDAARAADLTPACVLRWVSQEYARQKWAGATAVMYLSAVKGFTRWLCLVERCESVDHLSGLPASFDGDVHRIRRALSADDLARLLDAALASGRTVGGLMPAERHALYLTAASTGLRAVELSRLEARDLDARAEQLRLRTPAKAAGRRDDMIPLERAVIERVLSVCPPRGPLWPVRTTYSTRWWSRAAAMIRRDLAAAGIAYRDEEGRVFDFHSLRGQFATDLDRQGVSLFRAQKLMRHSDPSFTAKHYTRPDRTELARDAARLGRSRLVPATSAGADTAPVLGSILGSKVAEGRARSRKAVRRPGP